MAALRIALVQMKIGLNKQDNIKRALKFIGEAKESGSSLVVLPECFNSPYGTKYFSEYSEDVPTGETCQALSKAAAEHQIYIVGGSIPERDTRKLYNTCTVWDPNGSLLAKHRKVHLFDIDIPNGIRFMESDVLSAGDSLSTFSIGSCKIGLGICYDIRFSEMAAIYRNLGVDLLLYPGAFNMKTGPMHWELLLRSRAVDNQMFVAGVCGAQDKEADYVAWGHTMLVSPWGNILESLNFEEAIIISDIDLNDVSDMRKQIPVIKQRRTDIYDTILLSKKLV